MRLTLKRFKEIFKEENVLLPEVVIDRLYTKVTNSGDKVKPFIMAYCDAYNLRYKTFPAVTGRVSGIAKRLVQDLGLDRAITLVQTYLAMDDAFFLTRRHDLATMEHNLNAIIIKMETGKSITQGEVRQADRRQTNVNAFKGLLEKHGTKHEPGSN